MHGRREPASSISFGHYRIDLRAGRLVRDERAVPLRPKMWLALRYLVEHPGQLVTTDELLDAVWADVVVAPKTLTNVVAELRQALGDRGLAPQLIETVHGRGYRFIGAVDVKPQESAPSAEPPRDPLVGRTDELARLGRLWQRALDGKRQTVLVAGEPGIGKTTLLETFMRDAGRVDRAEDALIVAGYCMDLRDEPEPNAPLLSVIEDLAARSTETEIDVAAMIRCWAPTWLAQMPALLGPGEIEALRPELQGSGPQRMVREAVSLFHALARERPVLLVVEDLHWADAATIDVLRALSQPRGEARLLVIGTYRPVDVALRGGTLRSELGSLRRRCAARIDLAPFTRVEVQAFLEQRFGAGGVALALVELVEQRSMGNPLVVRGLLEHLVSHQLVRHAERGWVIEAGERALRIELPADLRGLIETQLRLVDPAAAALLVAASAVGLEFEVAVVAAAIDRSPEEVDRLCHDLASRGQFLAPVDPAAPAARGLRYRFIHAIYPVLLYETLPPLQRPPLHLRIGEALEREHAEHAGRAASRLAAQFERGHDPDRAATYHELATADDIERFDYRAAATHLRATVAHVRQLPEGPERDWREARLHQSLGNVLGVFGYGRADAEEAFVTAATLWDRLHVAPWLFRARSGLMQCYWHRADLDAAATVARQLVESAEAELPTLRPMAYASSSFVALSQGRFADAKALLDRCEGIEPEPGIPILVNVRSLIQSQRMLTTGHLGLLTESRRLREAVQARATSAETAFERACMALFATHAIVLEDDDRSALTQATQAVALAEQYDVAAVLGDARICWHWASARHAGTADASAAIRSAIAGRHPSGQREWDGVFYALLADVQLRSGDLVGAAEALAAGLTHVERTGERQHAAELHRLQGQALLAQAGKGRAKDTLSRAEWFHRRAVEIARSQGAKLFELRAAVGLAPILRRQRRAEEARRTVGEVSAWFPTDLDAPDLRAARRLLEEAA